MSPLFPSVILCLSYSFTLCAADLSPTPSVSPSPTSAMEGLHGSPDSIIAPPITEGSFKPTVESLQHYKCPEWFRDAKFGIWAHWGPASVPMHFSNWYAREIYIEGSEAYKYHLAHYGHPSKFGYKDIIPLWTCEKFDPDQLMALYKAAGAKYFVAQANHHDNFDLWDSKYQTWNSLNYGPHKNIIALWRAAALKAGLRFGFTSHAERTWSWYQTNKGADKKGPYAGIPYDGNDPKYQELYLKPDANSDTGADHASNPPKDWRQDWLRRINDVVNRYDPDLMYVDGPVPFFGDDKAQTGLAMIANLYNHSEQIHNGTNEAVMCVKKRSSNWFEGIDTEDVERGHLGAINPEPWQTDTSTGPWFYDLDYKVAETGTMYISLRSLLTQLVDIVSKNGNLLLNVTQLPDGSLDTDAVKLLGDLGAWMKINGEGIYETRPWIVYGEGPDSHKRLDLYDSRDIRFTQSKDKKTLYAFIMGWSKEPQCFIKSLATGAGKITDVSLLGASGKLVWHQGDDGLQVTLPDQKPCEVACALKISGDNLQPTPSKIEPLVQADAEGKLNLTIPDISEVKARAIKYEIKGMKDQLYEWSNPKDVVLWQVKIPQAGIYEAEVTYAGRSGIPVEFIVEANHQKIEGKLPSTGADTWNAIYRTVPVDKLEFEKPGIYTVSFHAKDQPTWNRTGINSITLKKLK